MTLDREDIVAIAAEVARLLAPVLTYSSGCTPLVTPATDQQEVELMAERIRQKMKVKKERAALKASQQ